MLQGTENKSWRKLVRTHTAGDFLGVKVLWRPGNTSGSVRYEERMEVYFLCW